MYLTRQLPHDGENVIREINRNKEKRKGHGFAIPTTFCNQLDPFPSNEWCCFLAHYHWCLSFLQSPFCNWVRVVQL